MFRSVLAAVVTIGASLGAMPEAQAQRLVPCAREHEFCRVPYPTRVIYGVPGRSTERFARGRGIPCANEVFGDPAPGIPKRCAFVARGEGGGYRGYGEGYRGPHGGYSGRDRGGYSSPDVEEDFGGRGGY